jgi:RNA polymerase sigma-70 factor (ECF subfamily)
MTENVSGGDRENTEEVRLVRLAASGDRTAFRQLIASNHRSISALVHRLARNPEDVDDILQEVMLRAWKGLPNFREEARFSTWLYRIAVNTTFKWQRRNAESTRTVSISGLLEQDRLGEPVASTLLPVSEPAVVLEETQRRERLLSAVSALPPKQRDVVMMHYFDGRTCEEIGAAVGCSVGTVWSRLHYACKRLRTVLGEW